MVKKPKKEILSEIRDKALDQIKQAKRTFNEARDILNAENLKKKEEEKKGWANEAISNLNDAQKNNEKAKEALAKSKELISDNKSESEVQAKEAKKYSRDAVRSSNKAIRLKNKIEERTKKWIVANLTPTNIANLLLFFYTLMIIILLGFFGKTFVNMVFDILYLYFGRYDTARFASMAILMLMVSVFIGFVVWAMNHLKHKKTKWWFTMTLIAMFLIGSTGFLFVHMAIGQDPLELKLRNQSMDVVGILKCAGSSEVLLVPEKISCSVNPSVKINSASVTLQKNETNKLIEDFTNLSFMSIEKVESVYFQINTSSETNETIMLSTGSPYHFYTKDEHNELKARFLKYLTGILSLIFITIPLVFYQLKKIHEN
jgi:hypothetical protein